MIQHMVYLYINVDNIINVYCENVFEISIDLSHVLRIGLRIT